jgi:hypothetical protein
MRIQAIIQRVFIGVAAGATLLAPMWTGRAAVPAQTPNITVQGTFGPKVSRGRPARATVTMTIPGGYHANANKASESYLIPTTLTVFPSAGVTVGAVSYPAGVMKVFGFSAGKPLRVYEGRVPMSFSVTVPANYSGGDVVLQARVKVQSCDDKTCYAPKTIDATLQAKVSP